MSPPEYVVSVRSLCEFTARAGDLSSRFTPAPSAQQGLAGHGAVTSRRPPGYLRELPLTARHRNLTVRGRADGYDPATNRLEEIKTHRGQLDRLPANQRHLHWAQLKLYGAMLCMARGLPRLDLALVYFDIKDGAETVVLEGHEASALCAYFETQCAAFLDWARLELEHRERRDRFLDSLRFPHGTLRHGQRDMANAVFRRLRDGGALMVQAPTGIGKTIGSLFPALKAVPRALDRIFYLTAKTSGREPALSALAAIAGPEETRDDAPLRVLELVAKEAACRHPGRACEADECPLAAGFYDRLPQARRAAVARSMLTRGVVQEVAAAAGICPYFLMQELARWCDVIVGDYNHYFDSSAILHGLTAQNQWRSAVLVDEAHNLVPRAREMYSATLDTAVLDAGLSQAPAAIRAELGIVLRVARALCAERVEEYSTRDSVPHDLVGCLGRLTSAIADEIVANGAVSEEILRIHFDSLRFLRLAESFGTHSLFDVTRTADGGTACLRNISPAPFLAPRFAACRSSVLFSATLTPPRFHRRLLGLPEDAAWLDVDSPFAQWQLDVRIERRISTRFRDRGRSLLPIARLIGRQYRSRPGNYLAFFSSFDYLQAALQVFRTRNPGLPTFEQTRHMNGDERAAWLENFKPAGHGIGFAVLGSIFAEGIDLPGDRLIGAFITTLGLPRVDEVNAQIEKRMQSLFAAGYEFTYLYPGLQKVVQAAGRVIRTASDRGTVHLIDDRYMGAKVRQLLPRWWRIIPVR